MKTQQVNWALRILAVILSVPLWREFWATYVNILIREASRPPFQCPLDSFQCLLIGIYAFVALVLTLVSFRKEIAPYL